MIDKLEFLLAVARERNFGRAAEACGVAQPTLSAGIKSLEQTLGVLLVRRSSRFLGLTPEGERVMEWALRLVGDARAMRQEVRALRAGLTGEVRLAVIPTALPYTPRLTQAYRQLHPGVRFTILSRSSDEILELLNDLRVDAGLTYIGTETPGRLRTLPLFTERYQLVVAAGASLGIGQTATWAEAGTLPLCLLPPDMQNRRILDRLLRRPGGAAASCVVEADTVVALIAHVRDGALATIVSEQMAELLAGGSLFRTIPIVDAGGPAFTIGLALPDRPQLAPTVQALLTVARTLVALAV